jgi:hypothetical protein
MLNGFKYADLLDDDVFKLVFGRERGLAEGRARVLQKDLRKVVQKVLQKDAQKLYVRCLMPVWKRKLLQKFCSVAWKI